MNTRRTRLLLWLATSGLLALSGAVVALHALAPADIESSGTTRSAITDRSDQVSTPSHSRRVGHASLQQAAARDLRQQLFDPPVVEPKPPPPKPLPPVQLISTILPSRGDATAWVRDGQAARKVRVGDTVGPESNPATITAIQADRIVLDHDGGKAEITRDGGAAGRGRR